MSVKNIKFGYMNLISFYYILFYHISSFLINIFMIACRFLILFELFNRNTNFLCNRTSFFSKHKLSPVPLTWLHPV